jgi:hypothetical protein
VIFDCIDVWLSSGKQTQTWPVEVRQLGDGRGQGLFTVRGVGEGVDLCSFEGDVLGKRDLEVRGETDYSKVIMVEPDVFLRARRDGEMSLAWYANHSCADANARIVVVGSGDEVCAVLRARRDVAAGEEIVLDYRLSSLSGRKLERRRWHFECLCSHCRK